MSIVRNIENEWLQEEAEKTRLENVRTLLLRKTYKLFVARLPDLCVTSSSKKTVSYCVIK